MKFKKRVKKIVQAIENYPNDRVKLLIIGYTLGFLTAFILSYSTVVYILRMQRSALWSLGI